MSYSCLIIAPAGDTLCAADFHGYGIRLQRVRSWQAALALMKGWRFDATVLLADSITDTTCLEIGRLAAASAAPMLLVVRQADDESLVRALDCGATSWLISPTLPRVVAAKVRGLIASLERLTRHDPQDALQVGSLSIDRRLSVARAHGAELALTSAQFDALSMLAGRAGGCVRREEIASRCLRALRPGRGVDMLICRLRRLLESAGADDVALITRYGQGYSLVPATCRSASRRWSHREPKTPALRPGPGLGLARLPGGGRRA